MAPTLAQMIADARAAVREVRPAEASEPTRDVIVRIGEIRSDTRLVVYCAGGYRAAIGISLLRRTGLQQVSDLVGGLGAWDSSRVAAVG